MSSPEGGRRRVPVSRRHSIAGRYWCSPQPRGCAGREAVSALEPKRVVIQLAKDSCTDSRCRSAPAGPTWQARQGHRALRHGRGRRNWLRSTRRGMVHAADARCVDAVLRFNHRGQKVKIDFAQVEGALRLPNPKNSSAAWPGLRHLGAPARLMPVDGLKPAAGGIDPATRRSHLFLRRSARSYGGRRTNAG